MFAGLSALREAGRREAGRIAVLLAAGVCALAVVLIGAVFFALSLHLWLAERIGAPLAALGTGAAAILAAFAIILVARLATSRTPPARKVASEDELSGALGKLFVNSFSTTLKRHGPAAAISALLAGFAVGASPDLRKTLLDLLKQWTRA